MNIVIIPGKKTKNLQHASIVIVSMLACLFKAQPYRAASMPVDSYAAFKYPYLQCYKLASPNRIHTACNRTVLSKGS